MDEKGEKSIHQYAGIDYNSKPPQQVDEKEVVFSVALPGKMDEKKRSDEKGGVGDGGGGIHHKTNVGKRAKGQSFVKRRRRRRRRRRRIMWQMKLQSVKSSKKMHCWQVRNRWGG
jgi:hypothetical protein